MTNQLEIELCPLPSQAAKADVVRRELAEALPADAYTLTVDDGTPSETVDAASWYLLGQTDRTLVVAVPSGGCERLDHLEVSGRDNGVWLGTFIVSTNTPGLGPRPPRRRPAAGHWPLLIGPVCPWVGGARVGRT